MAYKAVIEILIDVPSHAEACDAVAETMRDHMRKHTPSSCFVDWRYFTGIPDPDGPVEVDSIPADFDEDSNWPEEII